MEGGVPQTRPRESKDTNFGGIGVKSNIREWKLSVLFCASAAILLASLTYEIGRAHV